MSYHQQPTLPDGTFSARPATMFGQPTQPAQAPRPHRDSQVQPVTFSQAPGLTVQADGTMNMVAPFPHLGVSSASMPGTAAVPVGANHLPMNATPYFCTPDGQLVYTTGMYAPQTMAASAIAEGNFGPYPAAVQYLPQGPYGAGYLPGYSLLPFPSGRSFYPERQEVLLKEAVPGLENRRGSYSTIESTPGTPYYGAINQKENHTQIAVTDRSPLYSTPSPRELPSSIMNHPFMKPIPYRTSPITGIDLDALIAQNPAIPRAVPAVFTPRENMRTLEQSLSNPIPGNRNVYIRGLHPNTDDEGLAVFAARFGPVETSKAIIDTATGACKGFGFAKYYDVRHSELCIRGFYKLGYEVGFARESFNSRLKAEGDETSTNLYVSNLPKEFTETELGAIFMDYTVKSSKILRDEYGKSRGVGFARFESRDICEEIIKKFHGQPIGEEGSILQVRYADTPAQKDLKRVTSERRLFRTNEYNVGAYGSIAVTNSMLSPILPRAAQIARHVPLGPKLGSAWKRDTSGSSLSSVTTVTFKDIEPKVKGEHQPPMTSSSASENDTTGDDVKKPRSPVVATSPSHKA